jgi:beta-1,4-mannosyltransferase
MEPRAEKPTILAWPKCMPLNPYFGTISEGFVRNGWRVRDFSYLRALAGSFDILHVHYPTFPFNNRRMWITIPRLVIFAAILFSLRLRGKRIVWTVHNLAPHERYHPSLERRFMNWVTGKLDLTVHLSETGRTAAFERFPRLRSIPAVVIPHAHYAKPVRRMLSRRHAARELGLPEQDLIILFFGQIRPYKNVSELIRVFSSLQQSGIQLVVAGSSADSRLEAEIRAEAACNERVVLRLARIPEGQVELYFAAATLAVLPYREILNSGAALLSLTHRCPVLVPNRGAMAELQAKVGTNWVCLFAPPITTEQLAAAISWAQPGREEGPDLTEFSPEEIAKAHARAFAGLRARKAQGDHGLNWRGDGSLLNSRAQTRD